MLEILEKWPLLQQSVSDPNPFFAYALLALLVAIEGPAATFLGGTLAAAGILSPFGAFAAAAGGNFAADMSWVALGRLGRFDRLAKRIPAVRKFGPQIKQFEADINQHATRILVITKLSLGVAIIPALIATGAARVPLRRILPASIISEVIWTGAVLAAGYWLGDQIGALDRTTQLISSIGGVLAVLLLLAVVRTALQRYTTQPSKAVPE